jgi:ElaA protein
MAKISYVDGRKVRGKLSKKSKEVHRVRGGREQVYNMDTTTGKPSKAQKLQQSLFGKTNAIVNRIMLDPEQVKEWQARMEEYNRSIIPYQPPFPKRYESLRKYVYDVISEQVNNTPSVKKRKAKLPVRLPRGVKMQIKTFQELSSADLYEILKARFNVFVCEQHIIYLDEDNLDFLATHFALLRSGLVIAYARLFPDAEPGVMRIGRMLTLERGKGFGKYLMAQMTAYAQSQGAAKLRLHAQTQAVPFYEHLGFRTVGDTFLEADIPHILMECKI